MSRSLIKTFLLAMGMAIFIATVAFAGGDASVTVGDYNEIIAKTYDFYIKRIEIIFTSVFAIFGILLGLNIYNSHSQLKEAKKELDELKKIKETHSEQMKKLDEHFRNIIDNGKQELNDTVIALESEAKQVLKSIVDKRYKLFHLEKTRTELLSVLSDTPPDLKRTYTLLSELVSDPDIDYLPIFSQCLQLFPDNPDIALAISRGIGRLKP